MKRIFFRNLLVGIVGSMILCTGEQVLAAGWAKNETGWWYDVGDGTYPVNSWYLVDGLWYYFDSVGYMMTGFIEDRNVTYYCDETGRMVTGWYLIGSDWYYFSESGVMIRDQWIGNYYLLSSGKMAKNRYVGSYWVGENGAWNPDRDLNNHYDEDEQDTYEDDVNDDSHQTDSSNKNNSQTETAQKDGWVKENGTDWAYYENGERVRNQFRRATSEWFYLGPDGLMLKNQSVTVDGKTYWLDWKGTATEEKETSTLSISGHTKVVRYTTGDDFPIDGVITSNYKIESVQITIYQGKIKRVYDIVNPNTTSFDLGTLQYNAADMAGISAFHTNAGAKTRLEVNATDESGETKTLVNDEFLAFKAESMRVHVTGETKPSTVSYGSNFGLYGTISCNYEMDVVEGKICRKADGTDVVMRKEVYPKSRTYDLHGPINDALIFENLEKGSYYYIVTVTAEGESKNVIKKQFKVR